MVEHMEPPEIKKDDPVRTFSLLTAVLAVVGCAGVALFMLVKTRGMREIFAGMGVELPAITLFAITEPLGGFAIILLALAAILMVKEFLLKNKVHTLCINLIGGWAGVVIAMLWFEALMEPMWQLMRAVNAPPTP